MQSKALIFCFVVCLGATLAAPESSEAESILKEPTESTPRRNLGGGARKLLQATGFDSFTPSYGPLEGNTLMTITTSVDKTDIALKCVWDGSVVTTATVIGTGGTTVTCRTPKMPTGAKSLQIDEAGAVTTSLGDFTFFPTMFVSDFKTSSVLRYNADTGAFHDVFVQPRSGGLDGPWGLAFGLDHNLYVASERTNSVLVYDGSTGAFLKKFCTVKGQPRSLVFHYWDLYVVSAYGDKVYRYNGYTGSPRGVYLEGGGLDHPWGLIFDHGTNDTYVTSEYKDHVFRYKEPTWGLYGGYGSASVNGGNTNSAGAYDPATQGSNPQGQGISNAAGEEVTHNAQQLKLGTNVWKGRFDKVWTNTRVNYANGLDLTVDSLYVTGPYSGKAIVRFNRTTGEYMHHFEDEYLNYPVDIKEFRDYIYVVSEDQVRKNNRLNGEFIKTHSQTDGLLGSFLLFHISWAQNLGE